MANNDTAIQKFNEILIHHLSLHERHQFKTDTFESDDIDHLYKAVQNFQRQNSQENLEVLSSALKQCESYQKNLPYKELYPLLNQMEVNKASTRLSK